MKTTFLFAAALSITLIIGVVGCNSPESPTPSASQAPQPAAEERHQEHSDHSGHADHAEHGQAGHDHAAHEKKGDSGEAKTDMEKMTEALADFPAEDRESAMKQHFCPVSGQMLGTMGEPERVDVSGQSVWICCDGCKDKLLAEPDKYLAKLTK